MWEIISKHDFWEHLGLGTKLSLAQNFQKKVNNDQDDDRTLLTSSAHFVHHVNSHIVL
jgi:hypothetical protein